MKQPATDEVKVETVRLARAFGAWQAVKMTGQPYTTVMRWVQQDDDRLAGRLQPPKKRGRPPKLKGLAADIVAEAAEIEAAPKPRAPKPKKKPAVDALPEPTPEQTAAATDEVQALMAKVMAPRPEPAKHAGGRKPSPYNPAAMAGQELLTEAARALLQRIIRDAPNMPHDMVIKAFEKIFDAILASHIVNLPRAEVFDLDVEGTSESTEVEALRGEPQGRSDEADEGRGPDHQIGSADDLALDPPA